MAHIQIANKTEFEISKIGGCISGEWLPAEWTIVLDVTPRVKAFAVKDMLASQHIDL